LTKHQLLAGVNRTVGYAVTGYVSSLVAQQREHAIAVGLKAGLAIGVVTVAVGSCTPFVEWIADHVPERRMGVFGVGLIITGFALQSVQYWLALLEVSVR
jgi:MFS family permease